MSLAPSGARLLALLSLACAIGLAAAEPFTFAVYGDSRADGKTCKGNAVHAKLLRRMLQADPAFVVNTGDMVTGFAPTTNFAGDGSCTGADDPGSLRRLLAAVLARKPAGNLPTTFFPVVGNHDDNWGSKWYPDPLGGGFCDAFDARALIPNHTRAKYFASRRAFLRDEDFYARLCSTTDRSVYPAYAYYAFRLHDAHFVVLRINNDSFNLEECTRCGPDRSNYADYPNLHQLHFLEAELAGARADPAVKSIFVFLHAPVFGSSYAHPNSASSRALSRAFGQHRVTAVFSGHSHVYERSHPVAVDAQGGEARRDDAQGTVYVTTGGGGAPLHGFKGEAPWYSAVRNGVFHWVEVRVDGERVELVARDLEGREIDRYKR